MSHDFRCVAQHFMVSSRKEMTVKTKLLERARSALLGACLLTFGAAGMAATPMAQLKEGRVAGMDLPRASAFLGLPYAQPPVGELRWKPPVAPAPWTGTREATAFSSNCIQVLNPPEGRDPWTPEYLLPLPPKTSEDCLYLNVWTPRAFKGRQLPVVVWIHGGGFNEGSGSVPIYDGTNLAEQGVVVVTVNYRLDVFGFLAHPELAREQGTSGNYGLLDLVQALRWVKSNIATFGGSASRVTIAGQSAGATAVQDLMAMPAAKGLFARAIAESAAGLGVRAFPAEVTLNAADTLMKITNTHSIAELRALPAPALLDAAVQTRKAGQAFRQIIDGKVIPMEPSIAQTEAGGQFNDVPVLTGNNADEGSGFENDYGSWTVAALEKRLDGFGTAAKRARALYAPQGITEPVELGKQLIRERGIAFTTLWAKRRLLTSRNPTYVYHYTHTTPGTKSARYGAFHTSEVPYWFRNLVGEGRAYGDVDRKVSDTISRYWLNFIKTGNPNGAKLPQWPAYSIAGAAVMRLGVDSSASRGLTPEKEELYEMFFRSGGQLSYR
jgi:para-nitrobenzyl esterase